MKRRKLTIGFSPCPNDTFIFHGLMHGAVPGNEFIFRQRLEDVETLNRLALRSVLDVSKVSFGILGHIMDDYRLIRSGGALGSGCGPLVVSKDHFEMGDLEGKRIAVPGEYTTAFLLLRLFDPAFGDNSVFMPFHEIMEAVRKGEVAGGVIIHESRFTYDLYGLRRVLDLGDWWEGQTSLPIPLGGVVARRGLGKEVAVRLERLIRASIELALSDRAAAFPYIKEHSQELADDVINDHIDLYVNRYSLDLGKEGERAVNVLFGMAEERGIFGKNEKPLFGD